MNKYRTLHPFIAFGKTTDSGDIVDLTPEQAESLAAESLIAPYEIKVDPVPERPGKKKAPPEPLELSQAAPARPKRTRKSSRKSATKS